MPEHRELREVVGEVFREEALLIGCLATAHNLDDSLIWELCRKQDLIRSRILRKIDQHKPNGSQNNSRPHPAVQELLRKIKEN